MILLRRRLTTGRGKLLDDVFHAGGTLQPGISQPPLQRSVLPPVLLPVSQVVFEVSKRSSVRIPWSPPEGRIWLQRRDLLRPSRELLRHRVTELDEGEQIDFYLPPVLLLEIVVAENGRLDEVFVGIALPVAVEDDILRG